MRDIQNPAEVNALIAEERRKWPALDRWFAERRVSTYTREDLKQYPPGSIAAIMYKQLADNDIRSISCRLTSPRTIRFWRLRSGQTHDWEHILAAVGSIQ